MRIIRTIKAALPYLHSSDVRKQLDRFLDKLDDDLEGVGYVIDDEMESELKALDAAMNEHDEETAERRRRIAAQADAAEGEEVEEEKK